MLLSVTAPWAQCQQFFHPPSRKRTGFSPGRCGHTFQTCKLFHEVEVSLDNFQSLCKGKNFGVFFLVLAPAGHKPCQQQDSSSYCMLLSCWQDKALFWKEISNSSDNPHPFLIQDSHRNEHWALQRVLGFYGITTKSLGVPSMATGAQWGCSSGGELSEDFIKRDMKGNFVCQVAFSSGEGTKSL